MNSGVLRQWVVTISVIATIVVNALSQAIPFNGQTSAEIANRYADNYFLPANYVFSVWSIIYLGLIAYSIFQSRPAQRENPRLKRIAPWFVAGCIANCVWLVLFHYEQFWLSTVAMLVLLASLIVTYRSLRDGTPVSNVERWTTRIPFSIYLGWITVATVANFTYALFAANWDGFGLSYETWGVIMLVVAGLIAAALAYFHRDVAYAAVIVWAFVGIISRHSDVGSIVLSAGVMAALVAAAAIIRYVIQTPRGGTLTPRQA
ncbi:tryptophan-rich sensory protein [Anaerolineae bacterium CFX9]|nr:tryptophan-rich sensory protein [Anaerolineae bacterium CFX9]